VVYESPPRKSKVEQTGYWREAGQQKLSLEEHINDRKFPNCSKSINGARARRSLWTKCRVVCAGCDGPADLLDFRQMADNGLRFHNNYSKSIGHPLVALVGRTL
jgi:hypothetical protein